jgi:putative endopeptidase
MCMINHYKKFILGGAALAVLGLTAYIATPNDPVFNNLDQSVKPGDDFFKYANGGWLKRNPIPAAYSSWGIGNVVSEELRDKLKKINEDALAANAAKGSTTQKIGDFYFTGLDTVNIEKRGIDPLKEQLALIDQASDVAGILNAAAVLTTTGTRNVIGSRVSQDAKNSAKMMVQLGQAGLGLPNRDYYFKTDARTVKIRTDYTTTHLPTMLKLTGYTDEQAKAGAEGVFKIEKFLADSSRKLEKLRDPYANYHKMTIAQLNALTPGINWNTVFKTLEFKPVDSVIVGQPEYYRGLNTALKTFQVSDWKAYLRWRLISSYSPYLHTAADQESFRFGGKVISGRKEQLPRWKRVLDTENGLMGEALGFLFVKEYFPATAKQRYTDMVEAIRQAYREHIAKSWIG